MEQKPIYKKVENGYDWTHLSVEEAVKEIQKDAKYTNWSGISIGYALMFESAVFKANGAYYKKARI